MPQKPSYTIRSLQEAAAPFFEKRYAQACFALVILYSAVFVGIPFFEHNNLFSYDMAGMYFSSWYTSNYLFPSPIGWNPFFFFGFPQSQFYSPLYPYIVSALSLFLPTEAAFKTVLMGAVMLTPLSFYYFTRSFGFARNTSATIMALMFALLFSFPYGNFGSNIHSTFGAGFVAQALAVPFFFFYFGALKRRIHGGGILLPSVLLSLVVLSHALTAVAALLIPAAFIISDRNRKTLWYIGRHIFTVFLLTAFWVIPGVAKIGYAVVSQIGTFENNAALFAAAVALAALALLKNGGLHGQDNTATPADFRPGRSSDDSPGQPRQPSAGRSIATAGQGLPMPARNICVFVFLVLLLGFSLAGDMLRLPIHFYRFTMLVYLMAPFVFFSFWKKDSNSVHVAGFLLTLVALGTVYGLHPEGYSTLNAIPRLQNDLGSSTRTLVDAPPQREGNPHELQEMFALRERAPGVVGVFSESSLNSRFAFDVERELEPSSLDWGVVIDSDRISAMPDNGRSLIPAQLERLGISHVLTSSAPLAGWQAVEERAATTGPLGGEKYDYTLYKANDTSIVEALEFPPKTVQAEKWDERVRDWFLSEEVGRNVLVEGKAPEYGKSINAKARIISKSPSWDRMSVQVDAEEPVPVLIKISHFPNWRAYSDGTELRIYRASPYFMLVYAKGEFELRYEHTWSDMIGYALSAMGAIMCTALWLRGRKQGR
ncbi:MAG: hypothetical protein HY544_00815 [Candidatus Diapherotrites archaeon]|uniref:Membrane protein 6-pyruvoyl-tetrahydropterin synthase-related domain-containing protein n=1 Tax=Candidatus Iainarchaeum sp. TaxID=3101447 RepID=A0A8T3YHN4_9ARCH|nr:hypothetical protein [Candidatus Diapherotrites archaeon]